MILEAGVSYQKELSDKKELQKKYAQWPELHKAIMNHFLSNYIYKAYDETFHSVLLYDKKKGKSIEYLAINPPEDLVEKIYLNGGKFHSVVSFGIKNEITLRKYLAKKASISFFPRMLVKIGEESWSFSEIDGLMLFKEIFECYFLREVYPNRLDKEGLVSFQPNDLVFLEVKGSLYYNSFELVKLSQQQEEEELVDDEDEL